METNQDFRNHQAQSISGILQDLKCQEILALFIDDNILSIEEIFKLQSLQRHEIIVSLIKLCGNGLVNTFIAHPYIHFGLGPGIYKKLQVFLKAKADEITHSFQIYGFD